VPVSQYCARSVGSEFCAEVAVAEVAVQDPFVAVLALVHMPHTDERRAA
jgi:hypothetical protein